MNPWIVNLLRSAGSGGGSAPPPTGRTLFAPLKSSLVLSEGTGSPTFSRATKAWGLNKLGYLEELASGCAFFAGARLVRNIIAATEDASSGSWSKSTGTTGAQATDSSGGSTALRFTYGSNQSYLMRQNPTLTNRNATFCFQFRFKTDATHSWWRVMIYDGSGNQCRMWFNAQTGVIGNTTPSGSGVLVSATLTNIGGGWFALRLVGSPGVVGAGSVYVQLSANDGDGDVSISTVESGDAITIEKPSLVDVTGYDASYVPEYVSVGVVSAPFFGAGIDGAKYYETDWQGAPIPSANLLGFRKETAATNNLLYCRDLSNAAWSTKTNITATKTATGLDGLANTATTLTATATDAIILQPITLSSAARCASAYVKRRTGTGIISFTQDGGSSWTDITSQINSSTYSRVQITSTLTDPSVGFKISTSGDAIDVDVVQNEAGSVATSPIITTTATVTRNADSLTYQTTSNWSDTAGTAFVEVAPLAYSGGAIGNATNGLLLSTSNSGATAYDGTNSANGPSGTPGASEKLAMRWGSSAMTVSSGGIIGTSGTYDGGMGLSSIGVGSSAVGFFKNAAIYNYAMTDAELQAVTA